MSTNADQLAKNARIHEDGWQVGYIEAALSELDLLASLADCEVFRGQRRWMLSYLNARLAVLKRRFGIGPIDRMLAGAPHITALVQRSVRDEA